MALLMPKTKRELRVLPVERADDTNSLILEIYESVHYLARLGYLAAQIEIYPHHDAAYIMAITRHLFPDSQVLYIADAVGRQYITVDWGIPDS
jgi:hypothetical protein